MPYEGEHFTEVFQFHQGAVNDVITSPNQNYCITIGENGMIKVWDYVLKQVKYQDTFPGGGTCLEHMPENEGNKGRVFAAGFDNGIVRIFMVTCDGLVLLKSFRAHEDAIVGAKFSKDLKTLVTASTTGDIFFFEIDGANNVQKFDPLCTIKLPDDAGINDFKWNDDDKSIIFGCNNGWLYEVGRPDPKIVDNKESFLLENPKMKCWSMKIMEFQMKKNQAKDPEEEEKKRRMRLRGELPPEEEEDEEIWAPEPIHTVVPFKDSDGKLNYLVSTEGQFGGYLYMCNLDIDRPYKAIAISTTVGVTYMVENKSASGNILTIGY